MSAVNEPMRVAIHRLRREYGECLREIIAETVPDIRQVDDELRHLLMSLSAGRFDVRSPASSGRSR